MGKILYFDKRYTDIFHYSISLLICFILILFELFSYEI